MARSENVIPGLLLREGGWSNRPEDKGGPTNHGITLRSARAYWGPSFTVEQLRELTEGQASAYYRAAWWDELGLGALDSDMVAAKVLDIAVNAGPGVAVRLLQRALGVPADGLLGPRTLGSANGADPSALVSRLSGLQAERYRAIVARDPTQKVFLRGWLKRAAWPAQEALA